ncbi:CHAD domain-containing protein [Bradyrhizobium sp. B120]|uniref:CYTH and CHAD domain-containing protein n=1 Tax=Bradyrhizobium sp. B120 TaxID=3410088 RepID=UPI003B97D44A
MSVETELKFQASPRGLAAMTKGGVPGVRGADWSKQHLVSTYFDTNKRKLERSDVTLRVRQVDNKFVQTVKSNASGNLPRGEWEAEVDRLKPDITKADGTPLDDFNAKNLSRKLKPVFRTSIRRAAQTIRTRRSEIELAVDRGKISAGGRSQPIAEFELELKSGRPSDLFSLARKFDRKTAAELDLRSKAEKGYRLLEDDGEGAVHAAPIQLDRELAPNRAFRMIAFATLRHFSCNADAVRALDSEAVHQMRVGLRRTRAAISLFNDVLPRMNTAQIKTELEWLTRELAPAREIDVFLKERVHPVAHETVPKRGYRAIEKKFAAQRLAAFRRAGRAVASARFRRLLLDVLEWIETSRAPAHDERLIGPYAAALLARRIRKVRKQGKRLQELDPTQRHKLRIRIKKIRYAVEFFKSLYAHSDHKELAGLSDRLKRIQSALGSLNDFLAHREMGTKAALNAPRANRRAQAFVSGFVVGREREAARGLMKAASREIGQLRRLRSEPC